MSCKWIPAATESSFCSELWHDYKTGEGIELVLRVFLPFKDVWLFNGPSTIARHNILKNYSFRFFVWIKAG
jgi:hypothetical protein